MYLNYLKRCANNLVLCISSVLKWHLDKLFVNTLVSLFGVGFLLLGYVKCLTGVKKAYLV